ncbi:MAG: MFS transporter [Pseudomonadota bacterium]|nr:MFS transporter [Pseudomonadota bacterium]MEE3098411.1 MFS transporter [Pseudomonadota bacterium]
MTFVSQPDAAARPARARVPHIALAALGAAYFLIGVASLGAVGMVVEMGAALEVPPSAIAGLVTVFALLYALAAPATQALIGHLARRDVIAGGLLLAGAGCALSALAQDYDTVVAARLIMAVGAAMTGPTLTAAAASMVPPEERARALAIVFGGMSIASVAGIPLASQLAQSFGWRWAWGALAVAAVLAAPVIRGMLPAGNRGARASLAALGAVLGDRAAALTISVTGLAITAQFTTYALVAIWLVEAAGQPVSLIPPALLLCGVGGVVGNVAAAMSSRAFGEAATCLICLLGSLACMIAMPFATGHPAAALGVLALWSGLSMGYMAPVQSLLVSQTGDRAPLALALNGSAVYLGMAGGSTVAAVGYAALGAGPLPLVSAGLMLAPLALYLLALRSRRTAV